MLFLRKIFIGITASLATAPLFALDAASELAKKAQNPVENMISVPFNSNFNFDYNNNPGDTQYILDIKPVIPIPLNNKWNLITRTIIPVIRQPNIFPGQRSDVDGLGDINPYLYLSPAQPGNILWGIGPSFVFPTATNKQLGFGKYSIGPSVVVLSMPGHWVLGVLATNVWSIAGQSDRSYVNMLQVQYFINYNFSHGWYITSQPTMSASWMADAQNRWTVPIGGGLGRVLTIGSQPVNVSFQAYDNVKRPRQLGSTWQAELNISLLFPTTSSQ